MDWKGVVACGVLVLFGAKACENSSNANQAKLAGTAIAGAGAYGAGKGLASRGGGGGGGAAGGGAAGARGREKEETTTTTSPPVTQPPPPTTAPPARRPTLGELAPPRMPDGVPQPVIVITPGG